MPPTDGDSTTRRDVLRATSTLAAAAALTCDSATAAPPTPEYCPHPLFTPADQFEDVSRGNPKPFTLRGDALIRARLTPETWRLEVTADPTTDAVIKVPPTLAKPLTLDLPKLLDLGRTHAVKFVKAMQCLNIPVPLGQGLWEGVPLREVLRLCGKMNNVRRVYYSGFHNDDPKQLFRSSLSYTQVMETPPGELPVFVAYRLNGAPIPLSRGGPVRMIVPWAHGFKSIKWLQQITVTNDFRANDTYANANNDPESHLKTAAYLDRMAETFPAGQEIIVSGLAIVGLSGLKRVEYWVRPIEENAQPLTDDDPVWQTASWIDARLEPPPDWNTVLPAGTPSTQIFGFDANTGKPATWPMRYTMVSWSASIKDLPPGHYEVRARAVDLNGYAQPEPRPIQKTGKNAIPSRRFTIK